MPSAPAPIRAELFGSYTATAAGITVDYEERRRGSPVCALARRLSEAEHDPASELHVYRGSVLCFLPRPLGLWAGLVVEEGDNSPKSGRFAKYRPPSIRRETVESREGSAGSGGLSRVKLAEIPETA